MSKYRCISGIFRPLWWFSDIFTIFGHCWLFWGHFRSFYVILVTAVSWVFFCIFFSIHILSFLWWFWLVQFWVPVPSNQTNFNLKRSLFGVGVPHTPPPKPDPPPQEGVKMPPPPVHTTTGEGGSATFLKKKLGQRYPMRTGWWGLYTWNSAFFGYYLPNYSSPGLC